MAAVPDPHFNRRSVLSRDDPPKTPETPEAEGSAVEDASGDDVQETPSPRKRRRRARLLARVLGLTSIAIALVLFQFTQTATGRNAAASLLQNLLASSINGYVEIGPVIGGNIVTRLTVSRFEIRDLDQRLFVGLDTVTIEYDPLALLGRQLRIRRLHVPNFELQLLQGPDGRWNYDRLFGSPGDSLPPEAATGETDSLGALAPDPIVEPGADVAFVAGDSIVAAEPDESGGLRFVLGDASVENGTIRIRTPWTSTLEGSERNRALRAARSGDEMWALHETPDGDFERLYELTGIRGRFPLIRLVDPPRPFRLELEEVSGRLQAVRDPIHIDRLSASATFGDTVQVEVDRFQTERSLLFGAGWVRAGSPLEYDFQLTADPVDVADLAWLPIPMPASGGGAMGIDLTSRDDDMIVTVSGGELQSEDTRIEGSFTLAVGPRPRFETFDVSLSPLRLAWLDRLIEREGTIDGIARGRVVGSGRMDDLTIDADLTLEDLEPGAPPSSLRAVGGIGMTDPFPMRDLELSLGRFEARWSNVVGLDAGLDGRFDGTITLNRDGPEALAFRGEVAHLTPAGDLSQVSGGGSVNFADTLIDVAVDVNPLALAVLRPWIPDVDLTGSVSGPVRARGDREALSASATLQTARGRLTLDGSFDLAAEEIRYDTQIEATNLSLDQWIGGAPESRLAVRGRVNGAGIDPATLDAAFDLEILPSELDQAEIYESHVRFRVANGMATIDTLSLVTDVGVVSARGRFGLDEEQVGTVEFEADVLDLSDWDRWFVDELPGAAAAEAGESIFASFEAALAGAAEEESTEGLSGRMRARGVAIGRIEDFTVEAFLDADRARYKTYRADSVSARLQLLDPPRLDPLVTQLTATGIRYDRRRLDSLSVRVEREDAENMIVDLHVHRDSTLEVAARGRLVIGETRAAELERVRLRLGKLESVLVNPTRISYSDSGLIVNAFALNGPLGRIQADGQVLSEEGGELLVELVGARVDQLGYLISESPEVGGTLGGSARLSGTLREPRFTGTLRVQDPSIRNQQYTELDAGFEYAGQRLEGVVDLTGRGARLARMSGLVRTDLALASVDRRLLDDPFDLDITGDSLPLALIELRVQGIEEISGVADADISLRGAPGDLRYSGGVRIVGGRAWVPDLGVWLTDIGGRIGFSGSEARLDSAFIASDLGGSATIRGTVDVASLGDPEFDLQIDANAFHAVSRRDMSLAVGGRGQLRGSYLAPRLTGNFRLAEGDLRQEEFLRAREVINLSDPAIYGLLDSAAVGDRRLLERFRNPFMDNLVIDATVELGPNLWLRSPQLDVEVVSEGLTVRANRARDSLAVRGGVELPRGTYRFDRIPPYVQSLRITEGTIQFIGDAELNPNLDIAAEYRNRTAEGPVVIEARIAGTLRDSRLVLTSNPPMSETDQLCFLAVGTPCYLSADQRLGRRLVQETFLSTLSSGISSALVGPTGLSYFNLRSIGTGNGLGSVQGSQSVFDQTAVEFGWYAGEDIFFTFWQPLGGGPPRATLEWSFLPNWTLEARAASRFDERLFGLASGTNLANDRTFGLFLFREWAFGDPP